MKLFQPGIRLILSLGLVLSLGSCGGGSNSNAGIEGTGSPVASSPIVAFGSVTGFGSIYVNGLRFQTDTAEFIARGEAVDEAAILPGMVVRIDGLKSGANDPRALTVNYDRNLFGPVTAVLEIDSETKQLTLLGQEVYVQSDSAFDGIEFSDLAVADILEISGLVNDEGAVVATRIAALTNAEFEVEGEISALNRNTASFKIRELSVVYHQASFIDGTLDNLAEGRQIEIQGKLHDDGSFLARLIRFKAPLPAPAPASLVSIEGTIDQFSSVQSFRIGEFIVDASNARIERGSINQLAGNVRVAVQGQINAAGILEASSIGLRLASQTRLRGTVDNVDIQSGQLTLFGTTFSSDNATAFDDKSNKFNRDFALADIAVGDYLEVFGYELGQQLIAVRIKRLDNQGAATIISGPITKIESAALFYVMNVQVDGSNAEGRELIAGLKPGTRVEVEGRYSGAKMMVATHIRLASSTP